MLNLHDHEVDKSATQGLRVVAADPPGPGGAHHRYEIHGMDMLGNPSRLYNDPASSRVVLLFQNGMGEGLCGVTDEALLAIVAHRLEAFQGGPFSTPSTGRALQLVHAALAELKSRTLGRITRDVEGLYAQ